MGDIRDTMRSEDLILTKKHSNALKPGQVIVANRYGGESPPKNADNALNVLAIVLGTVLVSILGGFAFKMACNKKYRE
jgi:hypothetical protein